MTEPADFLIIGGGTAGAVLASRLSEDAATRVLLIEAGSDTPPEAVPLDIVDTFPSSSLNRNYFWLGLEARRGLGCPLRPFPQARIMGGGSSVMGLWALRGLPADFDSWVAAGASGWGWDDVVPYFRRVEDDHDRQMTGSEPGSVPIRRVSEEDWPAFVCAVQRASADRGLPTIADINEHPGEGFFPMPLSQSAECRSSNAHCYLTSIVRRRANLTIMPNTEVRALNVMAGEVADVTVERDGETHHLAAREVVLCAGAIHSPALMLRSGIGPAYELQRLGIAAAIDRPGIGRNLQNHPYLHFALTLPAAFRMRADLRRFAIAGMRLSSGMAECSAADLLLFAIGRVGPHSYGTAFAMLGAALYAPFSRGAVTLKEPGFRIPPYIDFRMFDDPRDPPRFVQAARFAESMLLDPRVAAAYGEAFLLPPIMSLQQFNRSGAMASLFAIGARAVLGAPSPALRLIVGRAIRPGRWFANRHRHAILSDDELLGAAAPMAHPVGTCAIGRRDDPLAVVDNVCRVYGLRNLRVVDASIMPRIPSANTNLPTTMIAERAADLIRRRAVSSS